MLLAAVLGKLGKHIMAYRLVCKTLFNIYYCCPGLVQESSSEVAQEGAQPRDPQERVRPSVQRLHAAI